MPAAASITGDLLASLSGYVPQSQAVPTMLTIGNTSLGSGTTAGASPYATSIAQAAQQAVATSEEAQHSLVALLVRVVGSHLSTETLLSACQDGFPEVRAAALDALADKSDIGVLDARLILPALGDSSWQVGSSALDLVQKVQQDALESLVPEARAVLLDRRMGSTFGSRVQGEFADLVADMNEVSTGMLDALGKLLDWGYWEVQVHAIRAFGRIRKGIPDDAIRRMLVLRNESMARTVRQAADEALATILSLETSIEDE